MAFSVVMIVVAVLFLAGCAAYPYINALYLKARMQRRLVMAVSQEGYRYRRSFRSIFLTRNLSRKYDMIIYSEKKLYAIKLWSSYFSYNDLVLTRGGRVREERRTRGVFNMGGRNNVYIKGFEHRVPRIKLNRKYTTGREVERVLLVYPSYENIRAHTGVGYVSLKTGDELFDKILYSPSAFVKRLKSESQSKAAPQ